MAWRCRGTLLAALLAAGLVAVSHAQLQSANVVNSSAIVVTLSASSVIAGDCSSSFNYTTSDGTLKPTSGASFVNCTATDATTLTLFYASGVSFASGDKINLRVNQTAVRNGTNTTALLPMAAAVAVQPVLLSAKLTTASTLVVDLPLSSTFSPANVSVCNSALVLQTPGAATAKADSFTACTASSSTQLTLTLAAGKYQPGDGVQVVFNQSVLVVGTTGYAPSKSPVVASPVILTASLTSSTGVALSLPTAGWLPAGANASVCNSVFVIRNGTVVTANALSACVIAPDGLAALLTLANSTYYGAGVTVNLNTNQTSFRAGTATGPLFLPATSNVAINPTIVSAALTGTSTVVVTLPVVSVLSGGGSTLATADCATTFAIKSPGASVSKAAFTACNLASNGLSITLTLAAGAAYTAGDSIDVASSSGALLVGTTPYTPRAQPVVMRPTLLGATYWNASALQINLPTASALASPFTPADCNSVFILRSGNATTGTVKPNAFSACSISGTTTIYATLATGTIIAPGDTIDVADGQWKLRAGSISTGPAYIPTAASISAGLGLATLTNATTVVVSLPAASTGISSLADCTAALAIYAADTTAKSSAISACSIAADGKSITVTLASATTYAPGDYIDVVASQTKLRVNSTTNSTMYYVPDTSTIDPQLSAFSTAAAAVLTSETSLLVTLPTASRLAFTPSTNGSDCNAAFELRSGTTAKTNPFTACSLLASSTSLSLTLAAGAYTAGDTFNVKPGNALLAAGTPSANALYVPGTAISIGPQLVSAAISNVTVFVKLPFVSSLAATFDCNATILLIPSGSTTPKTNPFVACSLSSDSKALILTLASASTYASGDMLQVKANQTTFLAGSTAYVPGTAITIMVPAISSAIITSATNVVATLNVDVAMTGTSADDCNNAFGLYASTSATTAKAGPPFLSCVVGTNKRTVTFTLLNATIFASADAINIKSGNTRLRVDNADTGVSLVPGASNIAINPVVSAAVATSATTVEVTLPLASYAVVGSCSNFISVTSSTGSSRTVSSCTLTTPFTVLAVTISGSSLASGDVVNVMVGNSGLGSSALRVGADSTGNLYVPSSTAVSVNPSVASATLTSSTTLEVALSMAGTLSAGADCNAILAIFPNASTTAKSSAITSCSIAASSPSVLTATLATAFAIGDSLNVRNTNAALTAGSLAFTNRTSAVPVLPAFASALATSSKTVVITLPTLSALVAPPSSNPTAVTSLTGSDCANILTVTNGVTSRTISTCTMATSTGATALTVTYTTEGMAAGEVTNTIASPSASLNTLRAGNTTSGTLYTQRSTAVTIHPALQSAVAGGPTTILVSLPMESSFYSAGSNPLAVSTLSASDCADIFVVAAGTTAKTITGCSVAAGPSAVAPSVVTITLASSTPFALSDTVNIASTHPVSGKATLRAFQTASSTTNTVAFLPLSTAITIGASLTSAVAIKSDTIEVNLPVNGYVFANQGTSPTTTALDATQSGTVFDATLAGGVSISTATMASASGATLVTLVLTGGSGYTAGTNKINIKTAATPASSNTGNLRTGATTSSAAFVPSPTTASNLLVLPGIVSAVAASSTRIVATLVINGKLVDSTGIATLTLTGADCSNILQVLPSGSTSAKTLATKDACTMTATSGTTTLTVNLAGGTGNTFAAGDTISILSTHGTDSTKAKLIDTTSSLAFAAGRTAVAISPVLGSITTTTVAPLGQQVVITLPVASKLYDASGNVATNDRLGATACTQILTWTDASNSATSKNLVDVSSVACSLSTDGTKLTVNLATAIAAGDKFTVKSYTAGQAALRAGTSSSGPLYIAGAVTISPSPFTAYATASDTIVVVLPVNSALYAGDNTPVTQLTATQCASVFQMQRL
ncbi:hypothetical protein HYH02_004208 [Chlamydomonas schloesseri]|uniref:Uncharacterized protein n=1 Tax=Chlamydomonas schloesseri TaxID=2026947 RepID=A0A836B8Y5_9CHLO|nr:hypothetical protein HYH02_004208 [Chlamydomonas schloesseri]|eukprot:KAG2450935.1 hypothetical protein HYH02_004208 [Chlamydomonas schloesseri]